MAKTRALATVGALVIGPSGRGLFVMLNDEAEAYAWLEPRRALDYPLNAPTRTLVRFFLERKDHLEELA
ncbi:hypothetical protein BH24DEI1_BH24DEI1_10230 [soil metagenome]